MSESMNDKGKGLHPVLHKGYGDPKFKYKSIYPDPPGLQWQQLKSKLKKKLAAGDFKTLWKSIASAPAILSKALTEANLNAAFDSTGAITYTGYANYQQGLTKDPSDKMVILSSNPHFATMITTEQGKRVLDCIDAAAEIVNNKDHIPEEEYPALLGDADNCPPVTGMELGLMAVNRQRCCILGEGLSAYREQKKAAVEMEKNNASRSGVLTATVTKWPRRGRPPRHAAILRACWSRAKTSSGGSSAVPRIAASGSALLASRMVPRIPTTQSASAFGMKSTSRSAIVYGRSRGV